ncbi:MAG: Holliday junction resolvase RuvX [Candidatus Thiodiazotropha sp. (ex Lucina aurantia)]|uniref:Putative pre-16S rRNA nuclease n=2 Tax=Candidatus Thiodiazotropha TaxID=1913444 RepID=A0A7Z1AGR7_9GAMM|nr:Holliday junction resolvase RuvX [Candidatus Thiodiazotropha endolucinida]MBT3010737.1 Holliday junction resolvase RuvX [Candidatus Thiodiazotropha sp. (ex Lucina pensylvanica)]MBT3015350.1 Holliday junction resolvase RuvX [Candidatus Thiodiazotropha taylori]MBT3039034.1 Holliday junction resolvase RuvX [Candidatus Thiodiazotropha sp. (ex Codakia orbicularis)]MBV2101987.1 Holliday junction resolvase RuvX [Candidatus Thiodiazotropha sp. (ex Lucina aurantia)]MBT3022416.1 Holliday junction res
MGTLLGFDYGSRKIGVAVGQTVTGTATALETLHLVNHKPDWQRIASLIEEWRPQALVVGLPLDVDDSETDATQPALRFSRQLEGRFHIKVYLADERYSSFEARDRLGHNAKRLEDYDAVAAKLILETWLNEQ